MKKFSVKRNDLFGPLQKVIGVIERRQTLPILANVLMVLDDDGLSLTGTDLEVQISTHSPNVDGDAQRITVPGRKLLDICRTLADDASIQFSVDEHRVTLRSGKSRFSLGTLPADDFPAFDEQAYQSEFSISQSELAKAVEKTGFCMAQQDVRYYLNGMMLRVVEGQLETVASDGHRLALHKTALASNGLNINQIILPRKGALEMSRMLDQNDAEATVKIAPNHVSVQTDQVQLFAKLIDGRFPDFESVIPKNNKLHFVADKQPLQSALQRVSILSNEKYRGIRLDISEGCLSISANNPEQDEAEEELNIDYHGEDVSMGFNASYLLDALSAVDTEQVSVSFTDTNSSCLLENIQNDASRFVIMPMRL